MIQKNNLDSAMSPYLRQHQSNPIWWQEWSPDVWTYAQQKNKPVFVSVGYATCHWCHVMAREAFSDQKTADYLNRHYVSIKVDREQRPDIDDYLMQFLTRSTGAGGWPLNAFLTPDKRPFYAMTYAPLTAKWNVPSFYETIQKLFDSYVEHSEAIPSFSMVSNDMPLVPESELVNTLWGRYDTDVGGFGEHHKFPPHTTLLFLLYLIDSNDDPRIPTMVRDTLDVMARRGLHDHLQGGFFRYCVDREWTIPHFEKMLYDQALLLWNYSLAYQVFMDEEYKRVAEKIVRCLDETFRYGWGYVSGHDADTAHEEGSTYVWTYSDLARLLSPDDFIAMQDTYILTETGNFEARTHLVKKRIRALPVIEEALLRERKGRPQPFVDKKIITSWNALLGVALVHAYRYLGYTACLEKAEALCRSLLENHYQDGVLARSSLNGELQHQEFLSDYASLLLFISYLYEESGLFVKEMEALYATVQSFYTGYWVEAHNDDFTEIRALGYDAPIPSSSALAEYAMTRVDILLQREYEEKEFGMPGVQDFSNSNVLMRNGYFHVYENPTPLPWTGLPVNAIQVRSKNTVECYRGICKPLKNV